MTLAFYTVFCGKDSNIANCVHSPPSTKHDCYFYTNNTTTGELANDEIADCLDAKHVKVCPHLYSELVQYEYTVFCDSKARVLLDKVLHLLATVTLPWMVIKHPFLFHPCVYAEYDESMKQPRYVQQKDRYSSYIDKQVSCGLKTTTSLHLCCTFIIRKMSDPVVTQINNLWWSHIEQCGIQDQITFFFVKQYFADVIYPIEESDRPFIY